jgi:hypothetical protein
LHFAEKRFVQKIKVSERYSQKRKMKKIRQSKRQSEFWTLDAPK